MSSTSLLPPNATKAERSLDAVSSRLLNIPVPVRSMKSPRLAPSAVLPWLAWEFSVDDWEHDWSDAQKRDAILSSVNVHRIKGTAGAVRSALSALGYEVRFQEWFQQTPQAVPYTFRLLLDVNQVSVDRTALQKILTVVESTKNLRSHLSAVLPGLVSYAESAAHAVALSGYETTVAGFGVRYSDGEMAWGLLSDAMEHGEARTVAAINELERYVTQILPAPNFWN